MSSFSRTLFPIQSSISYRMGRILAFLLTIARLEFQQVSTKYDRTAPTKEPTYMTASVETPRNVWVQMPHRIDAMKELSGARGYKACNSHSRPEPNPFSSSPLHFHPGNHTHTEKYRIKPSHFLCLAFRKQGPCYSADISLKTCFPCQRRI